MQGTFRKILIKHFKENGVNKPMEFLMLQGDMNNRQQIYNYLKRANNVVGRSVNELPMKVAKWFIYESEEIITPERALEPNPVRDFLAPLINNHLKEKEARNDRERNC